MTQDERGLKEYALDHLKHFDGLPCDFETDSGEVWDYDKCWALYEKWGLVDLMSENSKQ